MFTRIALTAIAAAVALGFAPDPDPAPTFSAPTNLTNAFVPFEPGSVKVFRGRAEGARTAVLEHHLEETRTFMYGGAPVECVILEEKAFEDGQLVEISQAFLAQDDVGNVRFFGEISIEYESGIIVGPEVDSWVVGPKAASDPPGVQEASEPAMYMIADPQVGDSFNLQSIPGQSETYTIMKTEVTVKTQAAKYQHAMKIQEVNDLEPGPPEAIWMAPGVGLIREKGKKMRNQLLATSLIEVSAPQPQP